jgi:phospholipase C
MKHLKWLVSLGAIGVLSVALPASVSAQKPIVTGTGIPRYQHVFLIMMENHSYNEIIGNPLAPKINALAQTYGLATNYFGVTHPSEPNYVASIGGSFFGIQDDNSYLINKIDAPSLASQLEDAGLTWKTYQQALPFPGYTGTRFPTSGPTLYASKHNPFLNFANIQSNPAELQKIVPDTQLAADLQSGDVPNLSYIVPDQCHDMHGTTGCSGDATLLPEGDAYVSHTVNAIMASDTWQHGNNVIVVTWDENDFSTDTPNGCCNATAGGGHVATIVIADHGSRGVTDGTAYNHYSLLQTIEIAFHLGCLQNTCDTVNVRPMAPLLANGKG